MSEINFVDSNGNFTHVKVDNAQGFIDKYKETKHFQELSVMQKSILECFHFSRIIETNMIPQGILLEIVMPSLPKEFKFSDYTSKKEDFEFQVPTEFLSKNIGENE